MAALLTRMSSRPNVCSACSTARAAALASATSAANVETRARDPLGDRLHGARQRPRVGIDEQRHSAFGADEFTRRRADARAAAGDQRGFALDAVHARAVTRSERCR